MSEAIQVSRLPSGLTVVTEQMDRVETVSLGAYVATGTRHERAEENGVSHFLEHMAFKGTERRTAAAIAEEIEAVGGHINAYTAREQTAYYCKVLKEDMALAGDIIGDILTHSIFEPEELERERGVILQEIGQAHDTPDDIIFDHFQEAAFPGQPMGKPVLGTEGVIRDMPRSTLTGYMRRHYVAGNTVIAAAGNLRHEQVIDLVHAHFGDLPTELVSPFAPGRYEGASFAKGAISTKSISCSAFPPLPTRTRTTTRRCCFRRCSAAACRRVYSRRCGRNAAWSIRCIRSLRPFLMAVCSASTPARARARPRS